MQARTERRSACSGVRMAAGAPSWVRGRARWASLRMFSFMLSHLLLVRVGEHRRGISDDGVSSHEVSPVTGFEPALHPLLVVLLPLKYPLSFATGEWV